MDFLRKLFSEQRLTTWLWVSLICNMGIVVTGGIVRLTGSGLGCPTWPTCTQDSFVPHGKLGIHGVIEFGNRTLTFILTIAALGAFITAWQVVGKYTKLWWICLSVGIGIISQAVVGGIAVWMKLESNIVALHLVLSILLIILTTWGLCIGKKIAATPVGRSDRALVLASFVITMCCVFTGTLVTGAGPHAGDANTPRNGLEIVAIARIHALSAWGVFILAILCFLRLHSLKAQVASRSALIFVLAVLLQGAIGYTQYALNLPPGLVWAHLLGLTILTAAVSWLVFSTTAISHDEPALPHLQKGL